MTTTTSRAVLDGLTDKLNLPFPPSDNQINFFHHLLFTDKNIVLDAKAGSGKTTTIKIGIDLLAAHRTHRPTILTVAFNRAIRKELSESLPSWVTVKTCHGLGWSILTRSGFKFDKENIDPNKCRRFLNEVFFDEWGFEESEESEIRYDAILDMLTLARLNLALTEKEIGELAQKYDLLIGEGDEKRILNLIKKMSRHRNKDFGKIDHTDMVFLPALYHRHMRFYKYDFVFVDEAQDLNRCQQRIAFLSKSKNGRMCFVGDPNQSIYAFAGADSESFDRILKKMPNVIKLPLDVCYRCAKKIIAEVNRIVPDIVAFDKNPDGDVNTGEVREATGDDFIISRTNAPLVGAFFQLIKQKKKCYIKGRNIGEQVMNFINKAKTEDLTRLGEWMMAKLAERFAQLSKKYPDAEPHDIMAKNAYIVMDEMINIISMIIEGSNCQSVDELRVEVSFVFGQPEEGICLTTAHKSKGLETDRVFILTPDLFPAPWAKAPWEVMQESNLKYVAFTRAKKMLTFVIEQVEDLPEVVPNTQ